MVDGEQYLTVMAGWGGALGLIGGDVAKAARVKSIARVLTFKIGGRETLPPLTPDPPISDPPALTASADIVQKGRMLYASYCFSCHGGAVVGGGVISDLRHLNAAKHAAFVDIVQADGGRDQSSSGIYH
jgi:quinohemoprotein ethanol dehydrogenase